MDTALVEKILQSPLAREAREALARETQERRTAACALLRTVETERAASLAELERDLAPIDAEIARAAAALESARLRRAARVVQHATASINLDGRERTALNELHQTVDPRISQTDRALVSLSETVRHSFSHVEADDHDYYVPRRVYFSNADRIAERLAAIREARAELEALRLSDADASPVLERIRRDFELPELRA